MCGEKGRKMKQQFIGLGSPPRMRGKVPPMPLSRFQFGITPAYAGKRRCPRFHPGRIRDHPRVCGEKGRVRPAFLRTPGSPPRVRGKIRCLTARSSRARITPAYAGKRFPFSLPAVRQGDHPRVCGEKQARVFDDGDGFRITPACAGKSARRQAGPPGPAPPPQMRLGWSPPPCTGRQCRTRKSTHARRARIPAPAHTPAPQ